MAKSKKSPAPVVNTPQKPNEFWGIWSFRRMIEISMAGKHSIGLIFFPMEDTEQETANLKSFCAQIYERFKDVVSFDSVENADIIFEVKLPTFERLNQSGDFTFDSVANIAEAIHHNKSERPTNELCRASESLLKIAFQRLNWSPKRLEIIKRLAQTIAWNDGYSIGAEHIAEAIQYNSSDVYGDTVTRVEFENGQMKFINSKNNKIFLLKLLSSGECFVCRTSSKEKAKEIFKGEIGDSKENEWRYSLECLNDYSVNESIKI